MNRFRWVALAAAALVVTGFAGTASAAPVSSGDSWTGAYLGGELGGRWSSADGTVNSATDNGANILNPGGRGASIGDASSFRAGVYGGYNWQVAPAWVVGVEGDWAWAENDRTLAKAVYPGNTFFLSGRPDDAFKVKESWDASLRVRVDYLVTPSALVYATGGAAWTDLQSTSNCGVLSDCKPGAFAQLFAPAVINNSKSQGGWTLGGGLEWSLTSHLLVRGEYRYSDYGSASATETRVNPNGTTQVVNFSVLAKTSIVTFGLAYKF